MNLVLFGPPGAGKGTQAQRLCERFRLQHLSTGDAIRQAIREANEVGRLVASRVERGELIPDELVTEIVDRFIARYRGQTDSFLFDGYPRTLTQIGHLEDLLEKYRLTDAAVVSLEVPETDLVTRITGRRVCRECGRVFNTNALDVRTISACDICRGNPPLIQRKDDTPETVLQRLRIHREQTAPVLAHYEMTGKLATIDGTGTTEQVFERIFRILKEHY